MNLSPFSVYVMTLMLGAGGAFAASWLGAPAPYLIGPAAVVTVCSIFGTRTALPGLLRDCAFLAVGLSMGSGITPEVIEATKQWPASFIVLFLMSGLLLFVASAMLQRVFRYDGLTAILAA